MKTVRDACQLQPNALSIKLSDQIEQLDELIGEEGDGASFLERTYITHVTGGPRAVSSGRCNVFGKHL